MSVIVYCDICGKVQQPGTHWITSVLRDGEETAIDYCSDACYATEYQHPPQRLTQRLDVQIRPVPLGGDVVARVPE